MSIGLLELAGWVLVLVGAFLGTRLGGTLLSHHHGDGWEVAGVLVVGLSAVGGIAWAGHAHALGWLPVALACAGGLLAGYRADDATA